jgi:hypothetical protein
MFQRRCQKSPRAPLAHLKDMESTGGQRNEAACGDFAPAMTESMYVYKIGNRQSAAYPAAKTKGCRHQEPRAWPRQRRLSCASWPRRSRSRSRAASSAGSRPAAQRAATASAAAASASAATLPSTAAPGARASALAAARVPRAPAWRPSCRETSSSGCSSTATTRRALRAGSTPTTRSWPPRPRSRPSAFLGQTSHETTGGWPTAPDGPFSWGYCFKQERNPPSDYCEPRPQWPCAPGKKYFGRGPIQISL